MTSDNASPRRFDAKIFLQHRVIIENRMVGVAFRRADDNGAHQPVMLAGRAFRTTVRRACNTSTDRPARAPPSWRPSPAAHGGSRD